MTDNELIAKFMGWKFIHKSQNGLVEEHYERGEDWTDVSSMKYHTSWDWLMPVCQKLDEALEEYYESAHVIPVFEDDSFEIHVHEIPITTGIISVYENVVALIKWYNEYKTMNP